MSSPSSDVRDGGRAGDDVRNSDIGRAYTELARITRRASIRARGDDLVLSVVDQSLVDFVVQHPGCMAIDIARYLRLNRSTISRQLSGLLAAGLVRTTDGGSGNAKPLEATDAGRAALDRSVRLHRDALEERLADWSDDDVALLAGLLERLGAADEAGLPMPARATADGRSARDDGRAETTDGRATADDGATEDGAATPDDRAAS